ncbi:hypothetical protein GQ602_005378 [Ophiocordyceps camponoti-floridani]|uniref:Uncharacterized protein n=1 Tax=Ophiocordyceps camponoti-floridani TaxID=2030778 RepID=A0A8H4Q5I7_9HYPO|nr:hypothetical protein GQ602_005378 [Ophiocordyceps camponoti-floridani]
MAEEKKNESFKEKLDRQATQETEKEQTKQPNTLAAKITELIPAAAKVLGEQQAPEPERVEAPRTGPPHRPHHDDKIEEFVRDQHRSMDEAGRLEAGAGGG